MKEEEKSEDRRTAERQVFHRSDREDIQRELYGQERRSSERTFVSQETLSNVAIELLTQLHFMPFYVDHSG